ncbi:hypothetical protein RCEC007_460017 [Escherichia coli]|nr:hypothetical protein RCEC007_460017 [Escherichia coli]
MSGDIILVKALEAPTGLDSYIDLGMGKTTPAQILSKGNLLI